MKRYKSPTILSPTNLNYASNSALPALIAAAAEGFAIGAAAALANKVARGNYEIERYVYLPEIKNINFEKLSIQS